MVGFLSGQWACRVVGNNMWMCGSQQHVPARCRALAVRQVGPAPFLLLCWYGPSLLRPWFSGCWLLLVTAPCRALGAPCRAKVLCRSAVPYIAPRVHLFKVPPGGVAVSNVALHAQDHTSLF